MHTAQCAIKSKLLFVLTLVSPKYPSARCHAVWIKPQELFFIYVLRSERQQKVSNVKVEKQKPFRINEHIFPFIRQNGNK